MTKLETLPAAISRSMYYVGELYVQFELCFLVLRDFYETETFQG